MTIHPVGPPHLLTVAEYTSTLTTTATIAADTSPISRVALSPDGRRLYASNVSGIAVIDLTAGAEVGSVHVGSYVEGLAVTPDGRRLYTVLGTDDSMQAVDVATSTVTEIG